MFDKLFSHTILWTEGTVDEMHQFKYALTGLTAYGLISKINSGATAMRSGLDIHEEVYAVNDKHSFSMQYCGKPETDDLFLVQIVIPMDTQRVLPAIKNDLERLCVKYFGSTPISGTYEDRVIKKPEKKKGCLAALPALLYALLPSQ